MMVAIANDYWLNIAAKFSNGELMADLLTVYLACSAFVRCRVSASKIPIGSGHFLVLKFQSTVVFHL